MRPAPISEPARLDVREDTEQPSAWLLSVAGEVFALRNDLAACRERKPSAYSPSAARRVSRPPGERRYLRPDEGADFAGLEKLRRSPLTMPTLPEPSYALLLP